MSAPLLSSVSMLDENTIEVVFDQAMRTELDAYTDASSYIITPAPPGTNADRTVVAIGSATVRITLPTDLLNGGTYNLTAVNVRGVSDELVSDSASSNFAGQGTRPAFSAVVATSKTTVRVLFTEPMSEGLIGNAERFSIMSLTTGKFVDISGFSLVDEGTGLFRSVDLYIAGKMTDGQDHELTARSLTDAAGNSQITGDVATFEGVADLPRMISATLDEINSKVIYLAFDTAMDQSFATSLSSYRIITPESIPQVYISRANISNDRQTVTLGISEAKNGSIYAAQAAASVVDEFGNELASGYSGQIFTGVGEAPTLVRWDRISANRVDVHFSEPMLDGVEIRTPTHYTFDNGVTTVAVLGVIGEVVQLSTTDITPGVFYTLTIA